MCAYKIVFFFVLIFHVFTICFSSPRKTIVFHGFSNCPDDEKNILHFNGSSSHIGRNKYDLNGYVKIDEYITGPLEVQATAKRCKIDRSQCEHYNSFIIRDICPVFHQKNQIWTDMMAHTQPRVKCPLIASTIKIVNATIDYSLIANLPLEGFTWIISYKTFKPIKNVRHKKQMVLCILSEVTVTNTQPERKRGKNSTTLEPQHSTM